MTHSPKDIPEINRDPRRIHGADEMWAEARDHLDKILDEVTKIMPKIYVQAGGNTDASVTFDFMKGYIMKSEQTGGMMAHRVTVLMCAAAITRLVRAPRANDPLAQLDKEI